MKYVLKGRIITFNKTREIIENGIICIENEKISYVGVHENEIPEKFRDSRIIDTNADIYPGLIDLHNHLGYNFLGLWNIDRKFTDRDEWRNLPKYHDEIKTPADIIRNINPYELVKYSEVKALLGGVTSIDGWAQFRGADPAWLLRNVEEEPFGDLESRVYQRVLTLKTQQDFQLACNEMNNGHYFIYHLAEGTSETLLQEYQDLSNHNLLRNKLITIHATALKQIQLKVLGNNNTKLVWSPLSNLYLYGKTADIISAFKEGILISLGADWSPTGSKSLLWELKVANILNESELDRFFTYQQLADMVTINPAYSLGWEDRIGQISEGLVADLVIFERKHDNPYLNLINATENDLKLSIINGKPRYGILDIFKSLEMEIPEYITIDSTPRCIDILEPGAVNGNMTFKQVRLNLQTTLSNPYESEKKYLYDLQNLVKIQPTIKPLRLVLTDENDKEIDDKINVSDILTIKKEYLGSVTLDKNFPKLDPLTMREDTNFFSILKANPNIPNYLNKLVNYII